jgi:catechol 2,3-dioxygenase-like lactoylglutathione lyase family enzyme/diadenosine tetraphosphate (Ap4A) HIT family hydrolase
MQTAIHRIVEACRSGSDPALIARMTSGWAVLGQRQVLPGYSLLLPDPVVPHLNALPAAARDQFMADLGRLGDAVLSVTGALRINYAIFGNLEPALHAHVHPRYTDEPEALRTANPWGYDWSQAPAFDEARHGALRDAIRDRLLLQKPAQAEAAGKVHHIDLTVSDIRRSTAFYDRWLPLMGLRRIEDCAEGPLWRGQHTELGLQQARASQRTHDRYSPGLHHLAFQAPHRAAVVSLHAALLAANETILDAPADYPQYAPDYFAVFFSDPDGIKLEYVFAPV